jgi:TetR/AcrR family transcriptional regulator, cholesterol catabolism regulator
MSMTAGSGRLDDRPMARRLLDSAAKLFAERGYNATSMQEVADALGLLKGSLYYYIDSKADLLAKIVEDTQEETLAILDEAAGRADLAPEERLRRYIEQQIAYNIANPDRTRIWYLEWERLPPDRLPEITKRRKRFEITVGSMIDDMRNEGTVAGAANTKVLVMSCFAVISWMLTSYRPDDRWREAYPPEKLARFIIDGVLGWGHPVPG